MLIAIYIIIIFVVAVSTTLLAVYVWMNAKQSGAKDFGMMVFGGSVWSWAAFLSVISRNPTNAEFFGEYIRYTIIPIIPIMFLVFVLEYTGRYGWLQPHRMPPIVLIPIITITLNWSRAYHNFFIYDAIYQPVGAAMLRTSWSRGPWFWIHSSYSYGLLALAMILLIKHFLQSDDPYRKQTRVLFYGILIASLANIPTTLQLIPSGLSLMPLGGAIMAVIFTRVLFGFKLFNISPVARDVVFDGMEDVAVVLDRNSRITDINPVAEKVMGWEYDKVVGKPLVEMMSKEQLKLVEDYAYSKEAQAELILGDNIFDMQISPLYDRRKHYIGRVIVLRDVTERVELVDQLSESEERFRQLAENSRDIVCIWTPDRKVEYLSPAFEHFTDISSERIYNSSFQILRVIHSEDREKFTVAIESVIQGVFQKVGGRVIHQDGSEFDFEGWSYPIKNEVGEVTRCIGVWRDMTERVQDEEQLQRQVGELSVLHAIAAAGAEAANADDMIKKTTEIISQIFPGHTFGLMLLNEADGTLYEHPSYQSKRVPGEQLLTLKLGEGISGKVTETGISMIVPDVSKEPAYNGVNPAVKSELCVPLKIGSKILGAMNFESFQLNSYTEEDEQLLMTIANQLAISIENVRLFEEVQHLAITDSLTNLHNRRHFLDLAKVEFERARRYKHPLSAMMIDIDQFKKINDTYGHAVGDEVLRTLVERSRVELRESDLMGRYGGEEFMILMPETNQNEAVQIAERLLLLFSEKGIETHKEKILMTISIGVASRTDHISDIEELINWADEALYKSKEQGGNIVSAYHEKHDNDAG